MKQFVVGVVLCMALAASGFAQQAGTSSQPTRAEVEELFQVTHMNRTTAKIMNAMVPQMKVMMHQMYLKMKAQCKLPPNFEAAMEQGLQENLTDMPIEQMTQAATAVYQKDLTHTEIEAMIAFYSKPLGQEVLRKMPAVTADTMKAVMPIMVQYETTMVNNMKDAMAKAAQKASPVNCPVTPGT